MALTQAVSVSTIAAQVLDEMVHFMLSVYFSGQNGREE